MTSETNILIDPLKIQLLKEANETLHLNRTNKKNIIFIYTPPKVGSTSLVTSFRIFVSSLYHIVHIHDEEMLKVLGHIQGITVNEIILYNKMIGKNVYVIDIYRSPIERKISTYFEKIGAYHFNNTDENINQYKISKVINRFNKIYPHIGNGDHFMEKYNISIPDKFDFVNKYLLVEQQGIKYIKLRLKDSALWGNILSKIFCLDIKVISDYESENKPIANTYLNFKKNYKIPNNFLQELYTCKYLNYYYSLEEKMEYLNTWEVRKTTVFISFTPEQYKLYEEISLENNHIDWIQKNHYLDEGCLCHACSVKRSQVAMNIKKGIMRNERIYHEEAVNDLINKRISNMKKMNDLIKSKNKQQKYGKKDFREEMRNIVTNKK
jgi:hypothetical protein